jgi:shikimate kinase
LEGNHEKPIVIVGMYGVGKDYYIAEGLKIKHFDVDHYFAETLKTIVLEFINTWCWGQ